MQVILSLIICAITAFALAYACLRRRQPAEHLTGTPISVNYHFTRQCNYKCKFCFHTAKTSYMVPVDDAKRGILLSKEAGMKKINFAGGEPFLHAKHLAELVRYSKQIGLVTSIVSNASLIKEIWLRENAKFLDILAVSCDSSIESVNAETGRGSSKGSHVEHTRRVAGLCRKYGVGFKLNTVVTTANKDEDMSEFVRELQPFRWKVFQCLLLTGENAGEDAINDATALVVTPEQYQAFITRHKHLKCLVPENNSLMKDSYVILDEYMRFLDCTEGAKQPSPSILDVGVKAAFGRSGFSERDFLRRGGKFKYRPGKDANKPDLSW